MQIHQLVFTIFILLFSNAVTAQSAGMIILDGSGSMWAGFGKKTKIEVARNAIATTIKSAPQDMAIGLLSFGHTRKGSCDDVAVLVEPSIDSRKQIIRASKKLNPTGRSVISRSLELAAGALSSSTEPRIMLITDGLGKCSANVCEITSELKRAQPNLSIDVIGLGLSDRKTKQLACISKNSGGQSYSINNKLDFAIALNEFFDRTETPGPALEAIAAAPAPDPATTLSTPAPDVVATVEPTRSIKLEPVSPAQVVEKVAITDDDQTNLTTKSEPLPKLEVEARKVVTQPVTTKPEIAIKATQATGPSDVEITVVLASDAGNYDINGLYKFFPLKGRNPSIAPITKGFGTIAKATLPAGRYLLRYSKDMVNIEYPFEVTANRTYRHLLPLDAAVLTVGLSPGSGKAADKKGAIQMFHGARRASGFGKLTRIVPAGTVKLSGKLGKSSINKTIEVQSGSIVERTYVVAAARLNVTATYTKGGESVNGRIISHRVYPLDPSADNTNQPVAQSFGNGQFIVPPGDYIVRSLLGDTIVDSSVNLSTDKPTDLVVNMNAGTLAVTALDARRISVLSSELDPKGERTVLSSDYGDTYQAILPPGEYTVAATYGDSSDVLEKKFSVIAGKRTVANLTK